MAKKAISVRRPVPVVLATISLIRNSFATEDGGSTDIYHVAIPKPVYDNYNNQGRNILIIFKYFQDSGDDDGGLSDRLLEKDFISDISNVKMEVREIDHWLDDKEKDELINNIDNGLFNELDEILDKLAEDYNIENTAEFLKEYLMKRRGLQL